MHWVRGMMDLYEIAGDDWAELLELTRAARARGWWRNYGLDDRGYVPLESEATLVRAFQVVPDPRPAADSTGTPGPCSSAAMRRRTEAQLDDQLQVRAIRHRRLSAEPPLELAAILDEAALHRVRRRAGGHARPARPPGRGRRAAERHRASAAVRAPARTRRWKARSPCSASATSANRTWSTSSTPGAPSHLEQPLDVAEARLAFDRLRSEALGLAASVELIERIAHRH